MDQDPRPEKDEAAVEGAGEAVQKAAKNHEVSSQMSSKDKKARHADLRALQLFLAQTNLYDPLSGRKKNSAGGILN